jgi:hypothetical protein
MKSLAIIALLAVGFASQAMAGPDAEATPKFNPGVTPELADKHIPKYDIVAAKVVEGVKFANPAAGKGLNPKPEPPSQAIMPALPSRVQ